MQIHNMTKLSRVKKIVVFSENGCHFMNLLNLAKRSQHKDYSLSLTKDSKSESRESVKFIEKYLK